MTELSAEVRERLEKLVGYHQHIIKIAHEIAKIAPMHIEVAQHIAGYSATQIAHIEIVSTADAAYELMRKDDQS